MSSELNIALGGVLAARQAIEVVGSNIANARTEGYARRDIQLSGQSWTEADTGGSSVRVTGVTRTRDAFLEARLQEYMGAFSRNDVQLDYFAEIEGILQEPSEQGIGTALEEFFNLWQDLAMRPADATTRSTLLANANQLADKIRMLRDGLSDIRKAALLEVNQVVEQVNTIAERLADLNDRLAIKDTESSPASASLMDERDRLVRELADLVGAVDVTPNQSTVRLSIGSSLLVDGSTAIRLMSPLDVNSPVTMAGGSNGVAVDASSGKLAGLMALMTDTVPDYLSKLDDLAAGLVATVNGIHLQGISAEGRLADVTASSAFLDVDNDGNVSNEILATAGLPFALTAGNMTVNIVDSATGAVTTHSLDVNPSVMTVGDLVTALNSIANLSAGLDNGRLRISASTGYEFDFNGEQTSNLLTAAGVNSFFDGYDAATIRIASRLEGHTERIAAGLSTDSGDGANALRIAEARYAAVFTEGNVTLPDYYRQFVTEIGNDSAGCSRIAETRENLLDIVRTQEESLSGVSTDEEAARLMEYQQMYQACARYLAIVGKLTESLLSAI